jgi:hypothetical protein
MRYFCHWPGSPSSWAPPPPDPSMWPVGSFALRSRDSNLSCLPCLLGPVFSALTGAQYETDPWYRLWGSSPRMSIGQSLADRCAGSRRSCLTLFQVNRQCVAGL